MSSNIVIVFCYFSFLIISISNVKSFKNHQLTTKHSSSNGRLHKRDFRLHNHNHLGENAKECLPHIKGLSGMTQHGFCGEELEMKLIEACEDKDRLSGNILTNEAIRYPYKSQKDINDYDDSDEGFYYDYLLWALHSGETKKSNDEKVEFDNRVANAKYIEGIDTKAEKENAMKIYDIYRFEQIINFERGLWCECCVNKCTFQKLTHYCGRALKNITFEDFQPLYLEHKDYFKTWFPDLSISRNNLHLDDLLGMIEYFDSDKE